MAAQISYTRSGERTERETAGSGHRGWSFLTATGGSEVEVVVVVRRQCLRHRPGSRATRLGLRGAARRGEEGGRGGHFRVGGRLLPCRGRRGVENGLEQLNKTLHKCGRSQNFHSEKKPTCVTQSWGLGWQRESGAFASRAHGHESAKRAPFLPGRGLCLPSCSSQTIFPGFCVDCCCALGQTICNVLNGVESSHPTP